MVVMSKTTSQSTLAFVASIGVNAPINYTDGKYANIQNVLSDLSYTGLSLIRTASYFTGMQGQAAYNLAASKGIRFDMLLYATNALDAKVAQMAGFAAAHPGAIVSIEGPNEVNNFGATYNGLTGAAAAVAFQNDLYADVAANATLTGTTVYSYTMNAGASSTTGYDVATIHPYPLNGRAPSFYLNYNINTVPGGKPFAVTETGYSTLPSNANGVDGPTQAVYDLDMVLDAKAAGAQTVFLYELLDAYPDPTGTLLGNHFGMFDYANNPKPIATALHNLTGLLTAGSAAFVPGTLSYSFSGLSTTLHSMLLQKATGVFDIMVWDEQGLWNNSTHAAVTSTTHVETLHFARVQQSVAVYDPLLGPDPIAVYTDVSQVSLAIGTDPLVIEINRIPNKIQTMDVARSSVNGVATASANGMLIVGAPGSVINATGTHDTFVFHSKFGREEVNGFDPATDLIKFDKAVFADYAHVQAGMSQLGDTLVIADTAGDKLVLDHVAMTQLSASNFLFV